MAIDQQLLSFMPHVVTIYPAGATDNYGDKALGTARTARAYVEPNLVLTGTTQIDETHQPTRAYISDTSITIHDKIVFPDGRSPTITSIEIHTVVEGLEHTVVTFG